MRMSVAVCVYLARSDFGPAIPIASTAGLVSITLGLACGCYPLTDAQIYNTKGKAKELRTLLTEIYNCMSFVDPKTFAFDKPKLMHMLHLIARLDKVSYLTKATAADLKKEQETGQKTERHLMCAAYDDSPDKRRIRVYPMVLNPLLKQYVSESKVKKHVLEDGFTFEHEERTWTVSECVDMAYRFACYLSSADLKGGV